MRRNAGTNKQTFVYTHLSAVLLEGLVLDSTLG